jgi:hypothetical protein
MSMAGATGRRIAVLSTDPEAGMQVRGLVKAQRGLQRRLFLIAARQRQGEAPSGSAVAKVHAEMLDLLADVSLGITRSGSSPSRLPDPSKRIYQWLSYLSDSQALEEHLASLGHALRIDPRPIVELAHIPQLFKGYRHGDDIRLTISEAYAGAPPAVLESLVKVMLPHTRKKQHRLRLHQYADSEPFRQRMQALERAGGTTQQPRTRGAVHDLHEAFMAVNERYFGNRLSEPLLNWNHISTFREFGRYDPTSDTITLSRRLDAPDVPFGVVAYVVYHELLHRVLGVPLDGHRRRVHTVEFKQAERRFRGYQQAERFLEQLSQRGRQYRLTSSSG